MKYSLRMSVKDEVSLALGLISIISWSVAEIPQIITNYREKSAAGLSITFLLTWILGYCSLISCLVDYYSYIVFSIGSVTPDW